MKIDRSTIETRKTKEELIQLIRLIQARKDNKTLSEVEEVLRGLVTKLDSLEGRLL